MAWIGPTGRPMSPGPSLPSTRRANLCWKRRSSGWWHEGEAYDIELGLARPDGRRIGVRTIGRPEIEDGRVVRVGGNIVDITTRKWVEEQLRHERDLYNATLDVAGAVIVVQGADARLLRFNRQAELLTGYREAEVLGRDPYEFLIPPEERSAVAANLQPVLPGQLVDQENHWMHRDGRRRLIHWSNAGLYDGQATSDAPDRRRYRRYRPTSAGTPAARPSRPGGHLRRVRRRAGDAWPRTRRGARTRHGPGG